MATGFARYRKSADIAPAAAPPAPPPPPVPARPAKPAPVPGASYGACLRWAFDETSALPEGCFTDDDLLAAAAAAYLAPAHSEPRGDGSAQEDAPMLAPA